MKGIVLDVSIALGLCFEDNIDATVLHVVETLRTAQAVVPASWAAHVAEALLAAEARRRIQPTESLAFLALLAELQPEYDPEHSPRSLERTMVLAREHSLPIREACCLELAERRQLPIATRSKEQARAARKLGMPLVEPPN